MKKSLLLTIVLFVFVRIIYSQNYISVAPDMLVNTIQTINTGVDIQFQVDEKSDVYAIDQMVSIDRIDASPEGTYIVSGYLFPEKVNEFVALQIPVMMMDLSQPKAYTMATTVPQMLAWDKYPTYQTYLDIMAYFQTTYPNLCRIDTIMQTTPGGRKILVARITSNVTQDKPEFFYSSTMHGDETTGYYLMIRMIHHLLSNYGIDPRVTNIVDNIDLWICPNANPDGTYKSGNNTLGNSPVSTRTNFNGKDLNRNYPDPRTGNPTGTYAPIQPETYAFMDFAASRKFVMGANYHGGIELMNYPWDAWTTAQKPHADRLWWIDISREYADTAQTNSPAGYFTGEDNGITNGADWYVITGGRQDYMNWWHQCREITAEISNDKAVGTEVIENYWNYNYKSMLQLVERALYGVRGIVTDAQTGLPIRAKVVVNNHDTDSSHVYSFLPIGNYHRPIKGGIYSITFSAPCYQSQTHEVTVADFQSVRLDVALQQGAKANFYALDTNTCYSNIAFFNTSDSTSNNNTWSWDFGDGNTSNLRNPIHVYQNSGQYSVKLRITNACGQVDSIVKMSYINIANPQTPIVENENRCGSGSVNLSAQATHVARWFDAPSNGNLLHTGNDFITGILTETTSFYVENYQSADTLGVGDLRANSGGGFFTGTNTHGLFFNAIRDVKLISVRMNAQTAQDRTILLINSNNDTLQRITRNVPAGQSVVNLGIDIPQGTGYRLTVNGTNGLYRNNTACAYPYTQQGLIEIYNSTAGVDYYYFFYDWKVQAMPCVSERVEVQAIINNSAPADIFFLAGPDTLCIGQTNLVFQSGQSSGADFYEWILPQGVVGQSDSSSIVLNILPTAVSGQIKVRGKSLCGDGNYFTKNLVIKDIPSVPALINGPSMVCVGSQNVEFSITPVVGSTNYIWDFPIGFVPNTAQNQNVIRFDIQNNASSDTLFVASQNLCGQSDYAYLIVEVKQTPSQPLPISGPHFVCANIANVEYSVLEDENAEDYLWTLPIGVSGSGTDNTIELSFSSSVANGQISVQAQNQCGTSLARVLDFTVGTAPASIGNIQFPLLICQNQTQIELSVDEVEFAEYYEWTLPQGISGNSDSNSIVVSVDNQILSGLVMITAHNVCGQISTNQLLEVAPVAQINSINYPDSVCLGEPFQVSLIAENVDLFEWTLSSNLTGNSNSEVITMVSESGNQAQFSVSVSNQCGTVNSQNYTIYNISKPISDFVYQTNGLQVGFVNHSSNYEDVLWSFGDGNQSSEENPIHIYSVAGQYEVVLLLTNQCGQDSVKQQINVVNTQISEDVSSLKWYPNPVDNVLNIEFNFHSKNVIISIFDNIGRLCFQQSMYIDDQQSIIQIPIENFKSGVYYLKIEGHIKPFMFIVK